MRRNAPGGWDAVSCHPRQDLRHTPGGFDGSPSASKIGRVFEDLRLVPILERQVLSHFRSEYSNK